MKVFTMLIQCGIPGINSESGLCAQEIYTLYSLSATFIFTSLVIVLYSYAVFFFYIWSLYFSPCTANTILFHFISPVKVKSAILTLFL